MSGGPSVDAVIPHADGPGQQQLRDDQPEAHEDDRHHDVPEDRHHRRNGSGGPMTQAGPDVLTQAGPLFEQRCLIHGSVIHSAAGSQTRSSGGVVDRSGPQRIEAFIS